MGITEKKFLEECLKLAVMNEIDCCITTKIMSGYCTAGEARIGNTKYAHFEIEPLPAKAVEEHKITFRDLYLYICEAERNEHGFHFMDGFGSPDNLPVWSLHIYNNMSQVNICCSEDPNDLEGLSVANFVFHHDANGGVEEVVVVPCKRPGTADYFDTLTMPIDTPIEKVDGEFDNWFEKLGENGAGIKELLRDLLIPWTMDRA